MDCSKKLCNEDLEHYYKQSRAWGLSVAVDIFHCNPHFIRDSSLIKEYVKMLIEKIGMKAYGETQVIHFGSCEEVSGYSMVQFIETSLISAHFAEQDNSAYIDVFSCKPFNPEVVFEFTKAFFEAKDGNFSTTLRGCH